MQIRIDDHVTKISGYPYTGTVVSVFTTLAGNERAVVESDAHPGMLHIYSLGQLELTNEQERVWRAWMSTQY